LVGEDGLIGDIERVFGYGLAALFDSRQHRFLELGLMTAKMFFESQKFKVVVVLAGHDATAPLGVSRTSGFIDNDWTHIPGKDLFLFCGSADIFC
jgi:hypothetical protein